MDSLEVVPSKNNDPCAYKTALACFKVWPIETSKMNKREISCNIMTVQKASNLELARHSFAAQVRVKDIEIGNLLKRLYEADYAIWQVSQDLEGISTEDRRFLDLMDTETKKIGKHYQLPLPFKNSTLSLPNNRKVAEKHLTSLKNRFWRDSKYWSDYKLFTQDLLTKGYAIKSAGAPAEGKLPHHGVHNPNKSVKNQSCVWL